MTPNELMQHPYWARFNARFTACVNGLLQTGQMLQPESQVISQLLARVGPTVQQFVTGLIYRYATTPCSDQQLDQEIMTNFMPAIRGAAQQQLAMLMQQQQRGVMIPGGAQPVGFGYGPGFGQPQVPGFVPGGVPTPTPTVASLGGGAPPFTPADNSGLHGMTTNVTGAAAKPDIDLTAQTKKVEVPTWKLPESTDNKAAKINGAVDIRIGKFTLAGDAIGRRVAVIDNRIRYANDHDVINAYKSIFDLYTSDKKFLTVMYKQLKVVRANREEFTRMAQSIAAMVLKNEKSLDNKLRAILNTIKTTYSMSTVTAFSKLFLGEIDARQQCGEFVPSSMPQALIKIETIEQVLNIVAGELDKASSDALKSIPGWLDAFKRVVEEVVDNIVVKLPQLILDPSKDQTVLDDYSKVLPAVWSSDDGITIRGTDDLFDTFLVTREVIGGSRTDGAIRADGELRTKIAALDEQFTIVAVHRIVSWCNYPKSHVVSYNDSGSHDPTVYDPQKPFSDPTFFMAEFLETTTASKVVAMRRTPKTIYFEFEEETFVHHYGYTNDGKIWVANAQYWK